MTNIFFDLTTYAGIIAFIVVLTNILKFTGVVKDGEKFANTVQFIVSVLLTILGAFFPDWLNSLPKVDELAQALAELGAFVVPFWLAAVKVGNLFHDIITKIPAVNKVFGKRLTA